MDHQPSITKVMVEVKFWAISRECCFSETYVRARRTKTVGVRHPGLIAKCALSALRKYRKSVRYYLLRAWTARVSLDQSQITDEKLLAVKRMSFWTRHTLTQ